MGLRPGRTIRTVERPYTRVSQHVPQKSYVVGVPSPKIHQFEMGNRTGDFDTRLFLIAKKGVQIRDNALEAARVVGHKFLESKVSSTNYFMKILVYSHQVLREKPIATGAGADRYSQGMAHAFGKPAGTAAIVKEGQRIFELRISKANLHLGKLALKKIGLKIPTPIRIEVENA